MDPATVAILAFAWASGLQSPAAGQAHGNRGYVTVRGAGSNARLVRLIRGDKVELFNLKELRKHPEHDPKLQPGDIVEFPEPVF